MTPNVHSYWSDNNSRKLLYITVGGKSNRSITVRFFNIFLFKIVKKECK